VPFNWQCKDNGIAWYFAIHRTKFFSVVVPVGVQGRAGVYFEWFHSGNNEQIEWEEKNNISNNVFFRITH
jgi:hypothetical protein